MKKVITAVLLAASVSANASWFTGNDLHKHFSGGDYQQGFALGMVVGVASTWDGNLFCIPQGVTPGQMQDVVRQFIRAKPQDRHESAEIIIAAALINAYRCEKKGQNL